MTSSLLPPLASLQHRPGFLPFTSPACRLHHKCLQRRAVLVQAASTAADRLSEIQDALKLKQVKLQQLVQQEDYQQAAQQRDAITQLELDKRRVEIEAQQEAYNSIMHDIGQVIRHKKYEYRGVIIGYDSTCLADEGWIKAMRVDVLSRGRSQPFYHVLVDNRDSRIQDSVRYVAEENIGTVRKQMEIQHHLVEKYFTGFEDGMYKPTETIRKQYPERFRKEAN